MRAKLARIALTVLTACGILIVTAQSPAVAAPSSGFNDWRCRPSAAHPNPVVLLHGTGSNGPANFSYLGRYLAAAGYCAFAPTYGQALPFVPVGGMVSITRSAPEIAAFIDSVRGTTGAAKVDLVGHSGGGFHALYGPKFLGYGNEVGRVVALAPPTRGTTVGGLVSIADFLGLRPLVNLVLSTVGCQFCHEVFPGGSAVVRLNTGPIAQPGIQYTIIATRFDTVVTPPDTAFVRESGVRNLYVQDVCPADPVGHIGLAFNSGVADLIANALDPAHPVPVRCGFGPSV